MLRSRSLLRRKWVHKQEAQTLSFCVKYGDSVRDCWVDYFAVNQNLAKGLELGLTRHRLTGGTKLIVETGS